MREVVAALEAALRELEAARAVSGELEDLAPIIAQLGALLTSLRADEPTGDNAERESGSIT